MVNLTLIKVMSYWDLSVANFEHFFPNRLSTNRAAFVGAIEGALEQLRLHDLEVHHSGYVEQTYPLLGYLAIFKLAENVGSLVGGRGQKLSIGRVKWMSEGFMIQESDGGIAMAVMM
jgi:hypothetical protein